MAHIVDVSSILSRVVAVRGRMSGFCKKMESLVGMTEGAKEREAAESASVIERIEDALESIEYRIGELDVQFNKLSDKLG